MLMHSPSHQPRSLSEFLDEWEHSAFFRVMVVRDCFRPGEGVEEEIRHVGAVEIWGKGRRDVWALEED